MAACRQIVNLALRKLGKLGAGREARTPDAADALDALQSLYGGWVASGAFGRLHDVVPTGPVYTAAWGQRVTRESASLVEVVLPDQTTRPALWDYGRYAGGEQAPRDGSAVVIVSLDTGNVQTWLYDGTTKAWQDTDMLQLDDEAPRSHADRQGLAACLAMEISDQYGAEVPAATQMQAARYKTAMTTRFGFQRVQTADREAYF